MRYRRGKRNSKKSLGGGSSLYRLGGFLLNLVLWDITSEDSKIKYLFSRIVDKKRIESNSKDSLKLNENDVDMEFIENK